MPVSYLLFLVVGMLAGLMSGLLGVGGGVLVVPAFALIFGLLHFPDNLVMHMAAGSSLATMIITTCSSMSAHHRRGSVLWPVWRQLVPGIIIGTLLGTQFAALLNTRLLEICFGIFLLIVAVRMFLLIPPKPHHGLPKRKGMWLLSLAVGAKSGLLGVGGGTITVPFLTRCNVAVKNAVGTSTACGFVIAIFGTIGFIDTGWNTTDLPTWSSGYVFWPGALLAASMSVVFARVGARLAHVLPAKILKRIFSVFLLLVGIHLLYP